MESSNTNFVKSSALETGDIVKYGGGWQRVTEVVKTAHDSGLDTMAGIAITLDSGAYFVNRGRILIATR